MTQNKYTYSLIMILMMFSLSVSSPVYSEENDDRSVKPFRLASWYYRMTIMRRMIKNAWPYVISGAKTV